MLWVITAVQGTLHNFEVAAAKCMFWFSALEISHLQLIFLFQLLLWLDKRYFNIFVLRVLSREREREVFLLHCKTITFICTIHLALVQDIARSSWWNYGFIIIALYITVLNSLRAGFSLAINYQGFIDFIEVYGGMSTYQSWNLRWDLHPWSHQEFCHQLKGRQKLTLAPHFS